MQSTSKFKEVGKLLALDPSPHSLRSLLTSLKKLREDVAVIVQKEKSYETARAAECARFLPSTVVTDTLSRMKPPFPVEAISPALMKKDATAQESIQCFLEEVSGHLLVSTTMPRYLCHRAECATSNQPIDMADQYCIVSTVMLSKSEAGRRGEAGVWASFISIILAH